MTNPSTTTVTDQELLDALRVIRAYFTPNGVTAYDVTDAVTVTEVTPVRRGRKSAPAPEPVEEVVEDAEDEAEDEEAGDLYSREDLEGEGLRALKKILVTFGYDSSALAGWDKDEIIDAILDEQAEAEGTEAEAEESEEEAEEEAEESEEDEDVITEDQLREMSLAELKKLAREYDLTVKAGTSKDALIDLLLDSEGE